jgi:CheY-like chemotaxis protein
MSRVLVADDNPVSLAFLRDAIALAGHEVTTAGDGAAAVALAATRRFELILLDMRMPRVDGPEALRRIRAAPGPSRQAAALATSADAGISRATLVAAGFEDVLVKPVALDVVHAMLERYLGAETTASGVLLDESMAAQKTGGDAAIVAALRKLLAAELDALPGEVHLFERDADTAALRDRLHRLEASAGFCGASALALAIDRLRDRLERDSVWPEPAVADLLRVSAETRLALG